MSEQKLLPCPFCGGESVCSEEYSNDVPAIATNKCSAGCLECSINTFAYRDEKEAIRDWNKRVIK